MIKIKNSLWVFALAIFTYLFYRYLDHSKGTLQHFYVKGVFESYRRFWDFLFSESPVALTLFWFVLLVSLIIYLGVQWKRKRRKWYTAIYGFIMIFCVHYIWFYWAWGFNYTRLDPWIVKPVEDSSFYAELDEHIRFTSKLRESFNMESIHFNKPGFEEEIRETLRNFLNENGIRAVGQPRCRYFYPSGSLLVWSASGIYIPFAGESLIDPGLHPLAQAFTIPHELSHAFGVTHEAVCNFIAYKVCKKSSEPFIQYAASYNYLKYLLADLRRKNPDKYPEIYESLNGLIKQDLVEERKLHDRFPEFLPAIRSWIYDHYLKSHGMAEGEFTYNQMVSLIIHDKQNAF